MSASSSVAPVDGAGISMMSRRLFRKMDRNHDSLVTPEEMKRSGVLRKTGVAKTDDEEKAVFKTIDANKDGVVSQGESSIFFSNLMAGSPQAMAAIAMMLANEPDEDEPLARTAARADGHKPAPAEAGDRAKAAAAYGRDAESGARYSAKA